MAEIEDYMRRHPFDGEHHDRFLDSRRQDQSSMQRAKSPFTLSFFQQMSLTRRRSFIMLKNDPRLPITMLTTNFIQSLVFSSIFYNLSSQTDSLQRRATSLFFVIIMNAFGNIFEIITLYAKRNIIEKHVRYAFYHPSAEALSSMIMDLPYKVVNDIITNLLTYFMVSYCGFVISVDNMRDWISWTRWANPIFYGLESLIVNEFEGIDFSCANFTPWGSGFEDVGPNARACSSLGSMHGQDFVSGRTYVETAYRFKTANRWRNWGVMIAFMVMYGVSRSRLFCSWKTTLLDVLADRVAMGVVTADMLVDGTIRNESVQHKTGYVQQQDLHLSRSTVREALKFSAPTTPAISIHSPAVWRSSTDYGQDQEELERLAAPSQRFTEETDANQRNEFAASSSEQYRQVIKVLTTLISDSAHLCEMHPRSALLPTLILAYGIFPASQAFQFTGPTTTEKLDLTKPITVSWDATGGAVREPNARTLDLWFRALLGGNTSSRAGWQITANLSLANSNSYEWDPSQIVKLIEDNDQTFSPDAVHTFEARLLGQDGMRLATVLSDEYALDGSDSISDGSRAAVYRVTVAAAAIAAAEIVF
ncbi:ABC multidrug transporter A [Paramyrothecium foliicola]|nr:ABC multidrug transporter A [Paramyrothecium foliicola]